MTNPMHGICHISYLEIEFIRKNILSVCLIDKKLKLFPVLYLNTLILICDLVYSNTVCARF